MKFKELLKPNIAKVILTIILTIPVLFIPMGGYFSLNLWESILLSFFNFFEDFAYGAPAYFFICIAFVALSSFIIYTIISILFYFTKRLLGNN